MAVPSLLSFGTLKELVKYLLLKAVLPDAPFRRLVPEGQIRSKVALP